MSVAVYIEVGATNRDRVALADLARRQANYLGPAGFRAMSNQTDKRFREKGNLRMVFTDRRVAERFQERVAANCDEAVSTRLATIKKKLKVKKTRR
jgi:hypothetical protein